MTTLEVSVTPIERADTTGTRECDCCATEQSAPSDTRGAGCRCGEGSAGCGCSGGDDCTCGQATIA